MASHNADAPAFNGNYMRARGHRDQHQRKPDWQAPQPDHDQCGPFTLWVDVRRDRDQRQFVGDMDGSTKTALTAGSLGTRVWTRDSFTLTAGLHSLALGHRDEQTWPTGSS
jgi:hypothetical protein